MNKNLFYPLFSALVSSTAFLLTEIGLVQYAVQPLFLASFVSMVSGLFLFCFVKNSIASAKHIFRKQPFLILLIGIINAVAYLFSYYAITTIGATKATFFVELQILFIFLLAIFFLKEKLTLRTCTAGLLIIFGGSFLAFSFTSFSFSFSSGDLFCLLAAFFFSVAVILITKLVQSYDVLFITALVLLLTGVFIFFLSIPFFQFSFSPFSWKLLAFLLFLGLLEGVIWILYNLGLRAVGASLTSIIFGTVPFFTLLFSFVTNLFFIPGFFILPENLLSVFLGGVLMFLGIVLIYSGRK